MRLLGELLVPLARSAHIPMGVPLLAQVDLRSRDEVVRVTLSSVGARSQMRVTVLYSGDCPNWRTASANVEAALREVGTPDVVVSRQRVDTVEDAERLGFLGSPSILINGRDAFGAPDSSARLACRIYWNDGGVAGSPTVAQLVIAFRAAAGSAGG